MERDERNHPLWRSGEPAAEAGQVSDVAWEHAAKPPERVLVASDFSPGASRAIARVAWLPLAHPSIVHLVHVLAPGEDETAAAAAREALGAAAEALAVERRRTGGSLLNINCDVLRGDPSREISLASLEDGSHLVVVGRHGRRGISRHFLGSTAEQIVRKVGLPVLVAHERPAGPYRMPLFATDFEKGADRVLATLLGVTGGAAGEVAIVHGIEEVPADGLLVAGVSPAEERRYYEAQEAKAVRAASALGRHFEKAGVKLNLVLGTGVPARVVIEEARARGCDLIAVGTRARSGLPRLLLGTTAGAVLSDAPCDVLVVPLRE